MSPPRQKGGRGVNAAMSEEKRGGFQREQAAAAIKRPVQKRAMRAKTPARLSASVRAIAGALALLAGLLSVEAVAAQSEQVPIRARNTAVDHSKFPVLKKPFATAAEVTRACLGCHQEEGHQFTRSIHWAWELHESQQRPELGKRHLLKIFCISARGTDGACIQCHAAKKADASFGFKNPETKDCLVCHDQTGSYRKAASAASSVMFEGEKPIDWTRLAQSVGPSRRTNCGLCHFTGRNGAPQADLDASLADPLRETDVHMARDGLNFACATCHVAKPDVIEGGRDNGAAAAGDGADMGLRREASCESCHGAAPHPGTELTGIKLNDHVHKVACQTCHVPALAGAADDRIRQGGRAGPLENRPLLPHYDWLSAALIKASPGLHPERTARIWPFMRTRAAYSFGGAGAPLSSEHGFVQAASYAPASHRVAPKEKALACGDCHARQGRLDQLAGFYMPGRGNFRWLDWAGYLLIAAALAGAILHAVLRALAPRFLRRRDRD